MDLSEYLLITDGVADRLDVLRRTVESMTSRPGQAWMSAATIVPASRP
jgi:hypothetical protein